MTDEAAYPGLVERALRYLQGRSAASDAELCAHLFGLPSRLLAGPSLEKWSRILRDCLGEDPRFVSPAPGHWMLRSAREANGSGTQSLDSLEFVAIAVAVDGPKPWSDRVVGVAAARASGVGRADRPTTLTAGGTRLHGRWEAVMRPDRPRRLPAYLRNLGLGPSTLEDAPEFAAVADDLVAFLSGMPLVGVDVGLTVAYLQHELRRAGRPPLPNPLIDLVALGDLPFCGLPRHRGRKPDLDFLAADLGVPPADRRSLASLARLSADVGHKLLERAASSGIGTLPELLSAMAASPVPKGGLDAARPRPLLDRSSLESFPMDPGAYLLLDSGGLVLYVGKATCLRARLAAYFAADLGRSRGMAGIVEATVQVEFETAPTELEAIILEARLIERHQPRYNVQRRREAELVYLKRSPTEALRGTNSRLRWAVADRGTIPGCLGPVSAGDGARLLAEARGIFKLGSRRGTARWLERADTAWQWLGERVDSLTVMGDLTSQDLSALALVAPWPPLPVGGSVEDEPAEIQAIGHEGWVISGGFEESTASAGAFEEAACDNEEESPGDRRIVVLGKAGWLGSLSVNADATREDIRRAALEIVEAAADSANPSATAELAAALGHAARARLSIIPLRDRLPSRPARS